VTVPVNVDTNLAQGTRTATTVPVTSSTGTDATLTAATGSLAGVMISADKVKLDGIETGAQVNTVDSVAGKTGAVTLTNADVGLGNVTNDAQFKLADAGTAATANVTTSATDTTAGRLLKVGDFGLGGNTVDIGATSWNDITGPTRNLRGFLNISTDGPITAGVWLEGTYYSVSTGNGIFIGGILASGVNEKTYFRVQASGAWQSWREIYHQSSILGTVSESSGVPTGAVIERGSNANGEFVKFADGTLICTFDFTVSSAIATSFLGGFRSAAQTWTFPAVFAVRPGFSATPRSITAFAISGSAISESSAQYVFTAVTSQVSGSRNVLLTAIGRWF